MGDEFDDWEESEDSVEGVYETIGQALGLAVKDTINSIEDSQVMDEFPDKGQLATIISSGYRIEIFKDNNSNTELN